LEIPNFLSTKYELLAAKKKPKQNIKFKVATELFKILTKIHLIQILRKLELAKSKASV